MMKKIIVWIVFLAAVFGVVRIVHAFKSPWSMASIQPSSSVLNMLPPASAGCGEKCKYD